MDKYLGYIFYGYGIAAVSSGGNLFWLGAVFITGGAILLSINNLSRN